MPKCLIFHFYYPKYLIGVDRNRSDNIESPIFSHRREYCLVFSFDSFKYVPLHRNKQINNYSIQNFYLRTLPVFIRVVSVIQPNFVIKVDSSLFYWIGDLLRTIPCYEVSTHKKSSK